MMAAAIDGPDARPGMVAVIDLRLIPQPASTGLNRLAFPEQRFTAISGRILGTTEVTISCPVPAE